jgi:carboxyl-terminal processing protease|uniref:PDZ domain-containing protein n=1 Tax=Hydrogenobacter sp. TaxID=2152829 RepID=A0A7C2V463_9AQUI
MGTPLILILILFHVALGAEDCPKEELLKNIRSLMERHYLWWDKIKDLQWKDEQDLIQYLRRIGDRWSAITRQEEEKLWYSSSKMLGLGIRWDEKGYVIRVFKNSPAEKYGIKEGDLIISINDATDKSLWRKVLMDVKKGEIIKVAVVREGLFKEFYVVKGEFDVPVVEDVKVLRYGELRVGYVKINNFTQPALGAFEKALEELQQEGFDVLLLDLRDNGGGLISVAKGIVDMLVGGEGVMFYLEGRGKNFGVYQFKNKEGLNKPIILLVGKQTASAAELVAVLLKRHAKAIIVGENTVGKYVGSNLYPLDPCGHVLRLVTFEMKLPSGETITSDKGLSPDCKLTNGDFLNKSIECLSIHNLGVAPAGQP